MVAAVGCKVWSFKGSPRRFQALNGARRDGEGRPARAVLQQLECGEAALRPPMKTSRSFSAPSEGHQ